MQQQKLELSPLSNAINSLQDALNIVANKAWFSEQIVAVQNTLIAGVVQNFEFVYEISIKMIKRQLEVDAASPEEIDHADFRDILRTAAEKGLISNVDAWFKYRLMRNITSHTYNHNKAQQVYEGTLEFIKDAQVLLKKLEARNA